MEVDMEVETEDDNSNTVVEFTFTAVEIDLDYEFEAARFFDFTREESIAEAREAEMWFDSVESYPPSPIAVKLLAREEIENVNVFPVSKGFSKMNQLDNVSDVRRAPEDCAMASSNRDDDGTYGGVSLDLMSCYIQGFQNQKPTGSSGLSFNNSTRNDSYKSKHKSCCKPSFPRTSTLMKPTASQLSKQNQQRSMNHSRFQKLENNISSGVESQAAKRQKLEGGHLCKVQDTNQEANLIHKSPKRQGNVDRNPGHARLRITVPRAPDLATAHRASRIRQKTDSGCEHVASTASGFRALPLNRKIFEAPSLFHPKRSTPQLPVFQEFHLKTSERAMQSTSTVPSTSACGNSSKKPSFAFVADSRNTVPKRPHVSNAPNQVDCETISKYKALPLNKKIISSKRDLGVLKNSKRETPMSFNSKTEKRAQHAPPIDLFNKLSLASELQQDSSSHLKPPSHASIFAKGSKENRVCSIQQQIEIKQLPTEKLPRMRHKQIHFDK